MTARPSRTRWLVFAILSLGRFVSNVLLGAVLLLFARADRPLAS